MSFSISFRAVPASASRGNLARRALAVAAAAVLVLSAEPAAAQNGAASDAPLIVVDGHIDILLRLVGRDGKRSLDEQSWAGQVNFANLDAGGLNAVFFAVWIDPRTYQKQRAVERADQLIDCLEEQARIYPNKLALCDTADEVRRAVAAGRIASLLGIEGGCAINNDISQVERFRRRGVRYMTLTWRGNLKWAGSSQEISSPWDRTRGGRSRPTPAAEAELSSGGLTELGRDIVREMNRVGMVVDVSHVSDQTFSDALEVTSLPVMVSHSNARALSKHDRNISDDMLRALAANRGVIGVNFWWSLLEAEGRGSKDEGSETVTVETVLDQIDHMVKVAGIDTVGIGSDFEGMSDLPQGLETAAQLPNLFEGLRRRGYSEKDIRKIAGENFLRVLEANENPSRREGLH